MNKVGPYQFCDTCKCERNHNWITELAYKCITCNKETKVTFKTRTEVTLPETKVILDYGKLPDAYIKKVEEQIQKEPAPTLGWGAKLRS